MSSLTFGFNKKKDLSTLKSSLINEEEKESEDEEEIINVLEDNEIQGTRKVEKKHDLVIPMIAKNKWKGAVTPADLEKRGTEEETDQSEKSTAHIDLSKVKLEDRAAMLELLGKGGKRGDSFQDPSVSIPLILKNKVPEGFETDNKLDVSIRPDEPDQADYDEVPIEQYGMAMLRGMGWQKGSFGKHKSVLPITAVARPKGLGLGADRSQLATNGGATDTGKSQGQDDSALTFTKGAYCLVSGGRHKNCYGVVEGIDVDNAQIILKLTLSRKVASVSQYTCSLVSEKEFKKYSKYLNKADVDDYKKTEDEAKEVKRRKREEEEEEEEQHRKDDRKHRGEIIDDRVPSKKRRRHRDDDDHKEHRSHRKHESRRVKMWLENHLRVRIIDSAYKKGKYFKEKVTIEDVVSHDMCICRTDNGRVLDELTQSQLETVVPRDVHSYVKILKGSNTGEFAEMLEKNKKSYSATLQLLSDRDKLVELSFDDFCEYTGDIDNQIDY